MWPAVNRISGAIATRKRTTAGESFRQILQRVKRSKQIESNAFDWFLVVIFILISNFCVVER